MIHHTNRSISANPFYLARPVSDDDVPSNATTVDVYGDCKNNISRCFGLRSDDITDGCVANKSCTILLTIMPTGSGADFNLYWFRNVSGYEHWAGAALSDDRIMGNDSVTE